jgi:indolepyruvate ferredoxin oxidoreductase alpha subunit
MPNRTNAFFADGNNAIAWAAQDAGVNYISHYPGSPVNRVIDVLDAEKSEHNYLINHALNEHIAALSCIGASLCGARSLVVMKHVGLNIAADPLNYSAVCKIKGGMVVVVGTDPGARTSTGEEDVHWYAPQFNLPLLEPASVQGVYNLIKQAFSISEQLQLPVLVFVAGRIAYQSSLVRHKQDALKTRNFSFTKDPENLINVGARAVRNHRDHLLRLQTLQQQNYQLASEHFNPQASFGIITRGASYSICYEVIESLGLNQQVHLLNIELTYPIKLSDIISFSNNKNKIIIAEDQDGFLETMIKRELFGKVTCEIHGKDIFPAWGELTDELLRDYFSKEFNCIKPSDALALTIDCPERAGSFCEGCPHRSSFYGIDQAIGDGIIGGDIGCSSLPPHRTDWLLCMNAGIGISQGIAHLLPDQALVSTGGEGSFFHGGLISLQSAVENNINLTHIIFDNRSVAMTGHQDSPTSSDKTDLGKLLQGIGVEYIFKVNAFLSSELTKTIQQANKIKGVKAIWVQGDCALQPNAEALRRFKERRLFIHNDLCNGCTLCYKKLQCPAIIRDKNKQLQIDLNRCRRCAACLDVCPNNAIEVDDPNG